MEHSLLSMNKNRKSPLKYMMNAGLAVLSLTLGGCMDLYEPTAMNDTRIQVKQEVFNQDVLLSDVNDDYIAYLARHYTKRGGSPMDMIVTYDPQSSKNTAMQAANKAADITSALRNDYGVTNVEAGIMPVLSQGDDARLLVSYDAYSAHAPKGCDGMMPGLSERPLEGDKNYKLGCSIDTLIARQVSRPSDLLGRGNVDRDTDGRSAANIVDTYRTGALNEPLTGESASGGE